MGPTEGYRGDNNIQSLEEGEPLMMPGALDLGKRAPDFDLPGVDGRRYSLGSFADKPVLVLIFSCNHCPYVRAVEGEMVAIQRDYAGKGVQLVAINSNDEMSYPEDSFPEMVRRSKNKGFNFPYLRDETQEVVTAYGAVCTPHVFAFDRSRGLRYRGRIDDSKKDPSAVTSHDLRNALNDLTNGREVLVPESMPYGCSIKWFSVKPR
jgi:peroxiredoxin